MALSELVTMRPLWFYYLSIVVLVSSKMHYLVIGAPQVPCYFIFGDSLFDNGNNNNLPRPAPKANYRPYGVDFREGPTGRFSNGRTSADFIGESLGFVDYIPSFARTSVLGGDNTVNISTGVNYASGAAGIRDESGSNQGTRIPLNQQLLNHLIIMARMRLSMGNNAAEYLGKCIYSVGIGSNDYINNYFMPERYLTSRIYPDLEQYADVLIRQYSEQIRSLYRSGARKIVLYGVGTIGSTPFQVRRCSANGGGSVCVNNINNAALIFNTKLKSLVANLNTILDKSKITYIDYFGIGVSSAAASPPGAVNSTAPCCTVATGSTTGLCIDSSPPCLNRNLYTFYDAIHPSEISNRVIADRAYNAELPTDAVPYDINTLAQM